MIFSDIYLKATNLERLSYLGEFKTPQCYQLIALATTLDLIPKTSLVNRLLAEKIHVVGTSLDLLADGKYVMIMNFELEMGLHVPSGASSKVRDCRKPPCISFAPH